MYGVPGGRSLAEPVDPTRRPFFDRPYPVVDGARFAAALTKTLPLIGGVD